MNSTFLRTAGLLVISNTFMTFAWYVQLRNLSPRTEFPEHATFKLSYVS